MSKKWEDAYKLCKFILIYEPDNKEANEYMPLIREKLEESDDDEDDDDDDDSDSDSDEEDDSDDEDDTNEDTSSDESDSVETDDDADVQIPQLKSKLK